MTPLAVDKNNTHHALNLLPPQSKADQTVIDFNLDFPFSEGVLYSKAMDVSDLSSVRHFASWVSDTFSEVHILVNNAGGWTYKCS